MKYHQLRVAALHNTFDRKSRACDADALHAWHLWAIRADDENAASEIDMIKEDRRQYPSDEEQPDDGWREHIRSLRSTYFTRSNLL